MERLASRCITRELAPVAGHVPQESWYAAYTCANHEKRVAEQLSARSVEHLLPLYSSNRRWKDRQVQLELPLCSGYVFVRIALSDRLQVLEILSVARLIGFGGNPTPVTEADIAALKAGFEGGLRAEPHPYLQVGRRVRVIAGPLAGFEGILLRKKNELRFVISLDLIQRSVAVDCDAADVVPIDPAAKHRETS